MVTLDAKGRHYSGIPLNLSMGGILFQTNPPLQEGLSGTLQFRVVGLEELIVEEVRVIRTVGKTAAAVFLAPSAALLRYIALLAG
ncbi:MAG: hypothetical protein A3H27_13915 [Acidobacteria bacterium RIFCSPLOWO2_02_FULL_59_13]|nr:MAG: hypothetical protein A3H27_13915 [Acidobacteria bacterium RIFCSPLOWO2_02_FULL_59_13]